MLNSLFQLNSSARFSVHFHQHLLVEECVYIHLHFHFHALFRLFYRDKRDVCCSDRSPSAVKESESLRMFHLVEFPKILKGVPVLGITEQN